jgi:hypothetical protein
VNQITPASGKQFHESIRKDHALAAVSIRRSRWMSANENLAR